MNSSRALLPLLPAEEEHAYGAFRNLVLSVARDEFALGFKVAYLHSLAVPGVAEILQKTGAAVDAPRKRAKDTSIMIYELLTHGFQSDMGRDVVALLNRMHRSVNATQDLFLYVLLSLYVVPVELVEELRGNALTDAERSAGGRFFEALAQGMHLPRGKWTFQEARDFCRQFEVDHIHSTGATRALMASNLTALAGSSAGPAHHVKKAFLAWSFGSLVPFAVRTSLGLPRLAGALRRLTLAVYRSKIRHRPDPIFESGQASSTYPRGYRLDDLGPQKKEPEVGGK